MKNLGKKQIGITLIVVGLVALFIFYANKNEDHSNLLTEEAQAVETYIRENIKTIAPDEPVLGGSWYVVEIKIDAEKNSGEVVYEDGHIQSSARFEYKLDGEKISVEFIQSDY